MAKNVKIPPELKGKVEELKRALFMRESNRTAELYKELLSSKPDLILREPVQYDLARMLEKGGHLHLALEAYRLLIDQHPKHKSLIPSLKAAGILAYKVEQFSDCATYLQNFLKSNPPLSVDREEARKYLEKLPAGVVSKLDKSSSSSSVNLDGNKKEPSGIAEKISLDWKVPSTVPKVANNFDREMAEHSSIELSVPKLDPPQLKKGSLTSPDDNPIQLDAPLPPAPPAPKRKRSSNQQGNPAEARQQAPLGAGSLAPAQPPAANAPWPQQQPMAVPPPMPQHQQQPIPNQHPYGWPPQQQMPQSPMPPMGPMPIQGEGPEGYYPQPMQSPMYPYPPVHPSTLQQNYPPPPQQLVPQQPTSQPEVEEPLTTEEDGNQTPLQNSSSPSTPPLPSVYRTHRDGEDAEERFYRLSQSTFTLMLPRGKRIHLDAVAELVAVIEGISVPHAKKRILKRKGLIFDDLTIDEMMAIYPKVRKCHQALVFVSAPPVLRPHEIHEILSATIHEKGLKMSNESTTPKIKWEEIRMINCGIVGGEYQVTIMGGIPMREFRFIEKVFDLEDFLESGESDFSKGINEFLQSLIDHSPNAVESFTVSSFMSGKHKKPQSFSNQEEFQWFTTWVLYSHFAEVVNPEELSQVSQVTSNW